MYMFTTSINMGIMGMVIVFPDVDTTGRQRPRHGPRRHGTAESSVAFFMGKMVVLFFFSGIYWDIDGILMEFGHEWDDFMN